MPTPEEFCRPEKQDKMLQLHRLEAVVRPGEEKPTFGGQDFQTLHHYSFRAGMQKDANIEHNHYTHEIGRENKSF